MKSVITATTEADEGSSLDSPEPSNPPTPAELAEILHEDAVGASVALNDDSGPSFDYPSRRTSLSDTMYIDLTTLSLSLRTTLGASHHKGEASRRESLTDFDHSNSPHSSDYDVTTARAYIMGSMARAPISMLALNFVGPVLLKYAEESSDENGKVFGGLFKASSAITACYTLFAISIILVGPLVGAMADYTNWRKNMIATLLALLNICAALLTLVSPERWVGGLVILWALLCSTELAGIPINGYLPEVTSDQQKTTALNAQAQIAFTVMCLVFSGIALGINALWDLSNLNRVRMSCVVALCMSIPCSLYAVIKLPYRESSRTWEGRKHPCIPFVIIGRTVRQLKNHYPMVLRYLAARACFKAGTRSMAALATTYLIVQITMPAGQVTTVLTIAFLAGIPGAFISLLVGKSFRGAKTPLVVALGTLMCSMIVAPLVMVNEEDAYLAKVFGAFWGLNLGFIASWDEPYFTGLIPGGQEAEMFGLLSFAGCILEWLPPILFSVCDLLLNEGQRWGLQSLALFFAVAIVILMTIRTSHAKKAVAGTLHLRRNSMNQRPSAAGEERKSMGGEDAVALTIMQAKKQLSMIPESPGGLPMDATTVPPTPEHPNPPPPTP